ncbi:MAG TPA: hypothetical protein VK204_04865 [Nocardioidaceae bacterium]|nr:hypothetical protein [Nocardioidaceae bacterium]
MSHSSATDTSSEDHGPESPKNEGRTIHGLPSPDEVSQEELDEIEAERKRRLDPANRPEMAEVDNTDREFDLERGEFVDSKSDDGDEGESED